jgi:uncharacterized protein
MNRDDQASTAHIPQWIVRLPFGHAGRVLSALLLAIGVAVVSRVAFHPASGERYWRSYGLRWPPRGGALGYALTPLPADADVVLQGAVHLAPQTPARFILFFPGSSDTQLEGAIPILENLRHGLPLGAAVWSYRSAGGSTGSPSPKAAANDARAQALYLQKRFGVAPANLMVIGYSLGTGSALRLAADLSRAKTPPAVLLLMSPFRTLRMVRPEWYGSLLPVDQYSNDGLAGDVHCPVLIVAGDRDEALPIDQHARALARSFGARASYLELPGKGHLDYLTESASMRALRVFIQLHAALTGSSP